MHGRKRQARYTSVAMMTVMPASPARHPIGIGMQPMQPLRRAGRPEDFEIQIAPMRSAGVQGDCRPAATQQIGTALLLSVSASDIRARPATLDTCDLRRSRLASNGQRATGNRCAKR